MRNVYKLVSLETSTPATKRFFKDQSTYYINKLTDPNDPEHIKFKIEKVSSGEVLYTSSVLDYSKDQYKDILIVIIKTLNSDYHFESIEE